MLEGFWYIATESRKVRQGRPTGATLLNQPLVLIRDRSQTVHALEDRCAHRGVPLSAGWQEGDFIRCRYHGWRYAVSGTCVEIPAQLREADVKPPCVRAFPVREQDGWIWVYVGNARHPQPSSPPPKFPAPTHPAPVSLLRMSLSVQARMELAVDNFIDPAHVPFVHHGLFRLRHEPKVKEKEFTRLPQGFRTVSKNLSLPQTIVFYLLSPSRRPVTAVVDFVMPGVHLETFEVGSRWGAIMVVVTPIAETLTRLDFMLGWTFLRWAIPLRWIARLLAGKALRQDRRIIELQELGQQYRPGMHLLLDADTPAVWYRQLQRQHLHQQPQTPHPHPVPEKRTLTWIT